MKTANVCATVVSAAAAAFALGFGINRTNGEIDTMDFGVSSTSLAVRDINASKAFYEKLGFRPIDGAGSVEKKWVVLQKDNVKIGLFEGMFDRNVLTFNPTDARTIYAAVRDAGLQVLHPDGFDKESGPCSFVLVDPDGNPILFDQHNE